MGLLSRLTFGVCHYPEHWPESMIEDDFRRIADAGLEVVRMGEGAWGYFELRQGEFRFDLFDRAVDLCEKHGLQVIFGTPTYTGPAWIATKYPEVLRWNFQRQPMRHGSRRNYNYTSPTYLDLSDRICNALAEHYRDHPAIVAWQVDNEFNCHMDVSYAPSDTVAFRAWLRDRYGSLESLNNAWGTRFWSQQYDDWEQVDLPGPTPTHQNPTASLDEVRFISDCVVRFAARQARILRAANPRWEITHNALFDHINGPDLAAQFDFFSHDHYPLFGGNDWVNNAFYLAGARALSEPLAIMEHQAGPGGQLAYLLRSFRPGELRRACWQSVAHGVRSLLFFNWRTCPFGAECYWYGLLDQDDRPTRRLQEATEFIREAKALGPILVGKTLAKRVGVLRDFDTEIVEQRVDTFVKEGGREWDRFSRSLLRRKVPMNFVYTNSHIDRLENYDLLIAPHVCVVTPELAQRLTDYVAAGGTLVLTARSGSKDANNHIVTMPAPGLLSDLAGVVVDEFSTLVPYIGATQRTPLPVKIGDRTCGFQMYAERITVRDADPIGHYDGSDSLFGDGPCATVRRLGRGATVYVAGYCGTDAVEAVLDYALPLAKIAPAADVPTDVEVVDLESHLILINHTSAEQAFDLPSGTSSIRGTVEGSTVRLAAQDFAVLERAATNHGDQT